MSSPLNCLAVDTLLERHLVLPLSPAGYPRYNGSAERADDDGDGVPDVGDEYPLGEPDCPPAALTIRYVDGNMVLSWDGLSYRLQTSSVINRAWHQIHGATSPFIVPPTEAQQFFRLICH